MVRNTRISIIIPKHKNFGQIETILDKFFSSRGTIIDHGHDGDAMWYFIKFDPVSMFGNKEENEIEKIIFPHTFKIGLCKHGLLLIDIDNLPQEMLAPENQDYMNIVTEAIEIRIKNIGDLEEFTQIFTKDQLKVISWATGTHDTDKEPEEILKKHMDNVTKRIGEALLQCYNQFRTNPTLEVRSDLSREFFSLERIIIAYYTKLQYSPLKCHLAGVDRHIFLESISHLLKMSDTLKGTIIGEYKQMQVSPALILKQF